MENFFVLSEVLKNEDFELSCAYALASPAFKEPMLLFMSRYKNMLLLSPKDATKKGYAKNGRYFNSVADEEISGFILDNVPEGSSLYVSSIFKSRHPELIRTITGRMTLNDLVDSERIVDKFYIKANNAAENKIKYEVK